MTNMVADVQGDRAKTVTYGHWLLIRHAAKGGAEWSGDGWYDDEFTRIDGEWKITRSHTSRLFVDEQWL